MLYRRFQEFILVRQGSGNARNGIFQYLPVDLIGSALSDDVDRDQPVDDGPVSVVLGTHPVIFRIFHELNGNWFWWGGKNCTPDELKQLWHFTVSYLRDQKQVHNLLYAYNTDKFSDAAAWLERYPGDEWTDIAGFDIYQRGNNESFATEFGQMLTTLDSIAAAHSKIPALTEFGYNGLPDSNWWTSTFLKTLEGHKVAYTMAWRNAGDKPGGQHEFYVPYKGQASASDFIKFYEDKRTFFQQEAAKEKMYQ